MTTLLKVLTISWFVFFSNVLALSQNKDSTIVNTFNQEEFLPPLNVLIEAAKKNSPLLKLYNAEVIIQGMKNKSLKRDWSKHISLGASMQYGTYDSYVSNSISDNAIPIGSITAGQQSRYSLGVFVNLPVYSIYNRVNRINIGRMELEQARFEKEKVIKQLVELIIEQYADLLLARKILMLRNDNLNSINLQLEMGEQKFKSGQIKLSELVVMQGIQTKARIDLEKEKTNYYTAFSLLENSCGIKLNVKK